ncbi:HK97 family phage prohead protease [Spirosoma sp. KNUC1025]|uniref:HK97 family phage prohead protease n=1 Tax=Spirosoma sp. KNUC1025 TaxID=2894082 RepID=UPI0038696612|nr:HK97 family phage prohead protease [Spirosoma sp. KNUC1025]
MSKPTTTVEQRFFQTNLTVETRSEGEGGGKFFVGTGIVFNQPSRPLYDQKRGVFREVILPGAIDEDTDLSEVLAVFNHDENRLLGANYSGTLTFAVSDTGVDVRILKPENSIGDDCEVWVQRGDIRGMSFKFYVAKDRWEVKDDVLYRYVEKITKLMDLSLVTRAAYLQTKIGVEAATTRSYMGGEEADTRALYLSAQKKADLSDSDQAFLTGLVAQIKTQIDFVAKAIPGLTNVAVKRLAAGRLSDLVYSQSWMEEVLAEIQKPAESETPEATTDEDRQADETGEAAEIRSAEEESNPTDNNQPEKRSLEWYILKNRNHRNSLHHV